MDGARKIKSQDCTFLYIVLFLAEGVLDHCACHSIGQQGKVPADLTLRALSCHRREGQSMAG